MKVVLLEICPKCKQETLEVLSQVGPNIVGELKRCSNCGYSEIPEQGRSLSEIRLKKEKKIK